MKPAIINATTGEGDRGKPPIIVSPPVPVGKEMGVASLDDAT
jgi:hypothetical protein